MEAEILVSGLRRMPDENENIKRIELVIRNFLLKYPDSIIENPEIKAIGKSSQAISFVVSVSQAEMVRQMHKYFQSLLVDAGLVPEIENQEDTAAEVDFLLNTLLDPDSKSTTLSEATGATREISADEQRAIDAHSKYNALVKEFGPGNLFAKNLSVGLSGLPAEDVLNAIAHNERYMKDFLSYIGEFGSRKSKSKLLEILKKTPPTFRAKTLEFLRVRSGNPKNLKAKNFGCAFIPLGIGLLVLAFIIYTAVRGKTPGAFMWIFMSLVSGIFLLLGGYLLYDELSTPIKMRWYNEEVKRFKS